MNCFKIFIEIYIFNRISYNIYVYLITLALYAILLKCTKYVSLSSITVFFVSGLLCFIKFFQFSPFLQVRFNIFYPILILFLALFIVIKHRSNISRLQSGTESKIKWMKFSILLCQTMKNFCDVLLYYLKNFYSFSLQYI